MKLTLQSKFNETSTAISFILTPEADFSWLPGQYLRLEISHDGKPLEHWFTIASAPHEKVIRITTRLTGSTYKNALDALQVGDSAHAYGPDGDFIWNESERPKLMIAGGIGVTPFRSILSQRIHDGLPLDTTLLYFSRDEEIVYKSEFEEWRQKHPDLSIRYVIGERLTSETIMEHAPELPDRLVYISGPEGIIAPIGEELVARFGLPKEHLLEDWFQGYQKGNF